MTRMDVKIDAAEKRLEIEGRVARGEKVWLSVTLPELVADSSFLRARIRLAGRDVAMFPIGDGDQWTDEMLQDGSVKYTGQLNLNTVELEDAFHGMLDTAGMQCLLLVDYIGEDAALHAFGAFRMLNWVSSPEYGVEPGAPPIRIAEWAAETRARLDAISDNYEAFKVEARGGISTLNGKAEAGRLAIESLAAQVGRVVVQLANAVSDMTRLNERGDEFESAMSAMRSGFETALSSIRTSKQDALTFDDMPSAGSSNPVKSGGVYSAIAAHDAGEGSHLAKFNAKVDKSSFTQVAQLAASSTQAMIRDKLNEIIVKWNGVAQ